MSRRIPNVLDMFGWPGAGKDTIIEPVVQPELANLGYDSQVFATGDMFREAKKNKTPFGLMVQEYMDRGDLIPDELILSEIKRSICSMRKDAIWILNGFPRNKEQIKPYEDIIVEMGRIDHAFNLEIGTDDTVREAVMNQRANARRKDAMEKGLPVRSDDNEESLKKRAKEARKLTEVVDHFAQLGKVTTIDASPAKPVVAANVVLAIRNLFSVRA